MNRRGSGRLRGRGLLLAMGTGLALLASPTTSGTASAQSKEELDKARAMFLEGVSLAAANNCAAAIGKYQAVAKVKMTAQVAFNIGECEERLGKLVSALGSYRLAASLVVDNKPVEVSGPVGDRIKGLEERVPRLIIQRTEQTSRIELDGVEIGTAQIGQENFVDPGTHTVSGKIGETEVWRETVQIGEKEKKTITVKIDVEKFKPPTKTTATASASEAPIPSATPSTEPPSKVPAYIVGGAGVLSLGVGFALMGAALGTASDLDKLCGTDHVCPTSAKSKYDSGRTVAGVSEALLIAGGVGLAAGVVLFVRAASASKPASNGASTPSTSWSAPQVGVGVQGGVGSAGLSVVGRF